MKLLSSLFGGIVSFFTPPTASIGQEIPGMGMSGMEIPGMEMSGMEFEMMPEMEIPEIEFCDGLDSIFDSDDSDSIFGSDTFGSDDSFSSNNFGSTF